MIDGVENLLLALLAMAGIIMTWIAFTSWYEGRRQLQRMRQSATELDEIRRHLHPLPPPLDDLSERIRK